MYFGKQIKIVTTTISFTLLKLRISCQFVNVPDLLEIKNNGQGIEVMCMVKQLGSYIFQY